MLAGALAAVTVVLGARGQSSRRRRRELQVVRRNSTTPTAPSATA